MRPSTRAALSKLRTAMGPSGTPGPAPTGAIVPSAPADLPAQEHSDLTSSVCSGCLRLLRSSQPGSPPPPLPSLGPAPVDPQGCRPADDVETDPLGPTAHRAAQGSAMSSPVQPGTQTPQAPCIAVHGATTAVRTAVSQPRKRSRLAELCVFGGGGFVALALGQGYEMLNVSPADAVVSVEYPQFTAAERAAMELWPETLPSDQLPSMPATLVSSFTPFRSGVIHYNRDEAQRRTAQYVSTSTSTTSTSHPEQSTKKEQPSDGAVTVTERNEPGEPAGTCGLDLYCGPGR